MSSLSIQNTTPSPGYSFFTRLPHELTLLVLSFFNFKEIASLSLLSKAFKQLCDDKGLWRQLCTYSHVATPKEAIFNQEYFQREHPFNKFWRGLLSESQTIGWCDFFPKLYDYLGYRSKIPERALMLRNRSIVQGERVVQNVLDTTYGIYFAIWSNFANFTLQLSRKQFLRMSAFFEPPLKDHKLHIDNVVKFVKKHREYLCLYPISEKGIAEYSAKSETECTVYYAKPLEKAAEHSLILRFSIVTPGNYVICYKAREKVYTISSIEFRQGRYLMDNKSYASLEETIAQIRSEKSELKPYSNLEFYAPH